MTEHLEHVHQCPYCELRFEFVNEALDHVRVDHPSHAGQQFAGVDEGAPTRPAVRP